MSDISKCMGHGCPIREHCKRFTAPASEYKSYSEFRYSEDGCEYFIEVNKR